MEALAQDEAAPRRDAIRIVPLQAGARTLGDAAQTTAAPKLTYRGGPLLAAVKVFTVFWGSAWNGSQAGLAGQINGFYDAILGSALLDQLAEYSIGTFTIGHGSRVGSHVVTDSEPTNSVSDSSIQQLLQTQIREGNLPNPDANTLYMVYLPAGVVVSQGGGQSCLTFCGYHDTVQDQIFYGVIPSPDCSGCLGSLASFDALTSVSSHELCEAITDPIPGQGWYDDANGEIGDICAWQTKSLDGYTVQLEWSNAKNACV